MMGVMYGDRLRRLFPDLAPTVSDLFLLEAHQIAGLSGRAPAAELAAVLHAHPGIGAYLEARHPPSAPYLAALRTSHDPLSGAALAAAEDALLWEVADEIVYQRMPDAYDAVASAGWDAAAVTDVASIDGATVIDAGAGTGLVAFSVAEQAATVFAVEPVAALREYMRAKAARLGVTNLYVLDGRLHAIPLPPGSADALITCRAIGWDLPAELAEIGRVLRPDGLALHLIGQPSPAPVDDALHAALIGAGYSADSYLVAGVPQRRYRARLPQPS
jgi:SAM-dependent methyltransferase